MYKPWLGLTKENIQQTRNNNIPAHTCVVGASEPGIDTTGVSGQFEALTKARLIDFLVVISLGGSPNSNI